MKKLNRMTYRDPDGTPFFYDNSKKNMAEITEKLCQYEEQEEDGVLKRLPCKIGDTLYQVTCEDFERRRRIWPLNVEYIAWCQYGWLALESDGGLDGNSDVSEIDFRDMGVTAFRTVEEARKRYPYTLWEDEEEREDDAE